MARGGAREPRALIVDFGGVLTVSEGDVLDAFCAAEGIDPLRMRAVVDGAFDGSDGDGIVARRERGELTLAEFERALAAALSEGLERPIDPMGLHGRLFAAERVDEEMVEAVARLRAAGVPTAMLSNTWGEGDDQDALADRFDVVLLSGRIGMRKPEPAIFVAAADALAREPDGCVFVDDVEANVRAAEALGMHGVLHRQASTTTGRLQDLFGIRLGKVSR